MGKIFRINDLPKQFNLSNYNDTDKLTIADWERNLSERRLAYRGCFLVNRAIWSLLKSAEQKKPCSVKAISAYDIAFLDETFNSEYSCLLNRLEEIDNQDTDDVGLNKEAEKLRTILEENVGIAISKMVGGGTFAFIDLNASNEQLISDFSKFINEVKDASGVSLVKNNPSKAFLKKLTVNKVLPCLDLQLWARLENTTIPHHVMGEALFPYADFDSTEKVRKTTLPLVAKLMGLNELRPSLLRSFWYSD